MNLRANARINFYVVIAIIFIIESSLITRTMEEEEVEGDEESSDVYLRNVVNELQLINGISTEAPVLAQVTQTPDYLANRYYYPVGNNKNVNDDKGRNSNLNYNQHLLSIPKREPIVADQFSQPNNQIVCFPDSSKCTNEVVAPQNSILGFTTAELASMYRKALEQGAPLTYDSFTSAINERVPKFTSATEFQFTNPNKFQPTDSRYAYYFYPLQTFQHELTNNYGYKTLPDSMIAESSKKETTSTMNPILVGISSFLGMALFFVLSLYFYPRFLHYMDFPFAVTSRTTFQNDLAQLAIFVIEAIEYYKQYIQLRS